VDFVACEDGAITFYYCPLGSFCDVVEGTTGCYCDNASDGICPDGACVDDDDCGACVPQCAGKQCGPNGCNGECGTCGPTEECDTLSGQCVAQCTAAASYSPGALDGSALEANIDNNARFIGFFAPLDSEILPDRIAIDMFYYWGSFEGYATGTYALGSDPKAYVAIVTNCQTFGDVACNAKAATYRATSGTLVVTSVEGHFSGTITDVVLSSSDELGCTVSIGSASFDAPIE